MVVKEYLLGLVRPHLFALRNRIDKSIERTNDFISANSGVSSATPNTVARRTATGGLNVNGLTSTGNVAIVGDNNLTFDTDADIASLTSHDTVLTLLSTESPRVAQMNTVPGVRRMLKVSDIDTMFINAGAFRPDDSDSPDIEVIDLGLYSIDVLRYGTDSIKHASITFKLPQTIYETFSYRFIFTHTAAADGAIVLGHNTFYNLSTNLANNQSMVIDISGSAANTYHLSNWFTLATTKDNLIHFDIYRDPTNANDTNTGDIDIIGVEMKFTYKYDVTS